MSSERMTSQEYWAEVASLAESVLEEGRADGQSDDEIMSDRLWETIDGHQWVIYTAYHYEVLSHSDNSGYTVEQFGTDELIKGGELNTAALAFGALYGDVSDKLYRLVESES